MFMRVSAKDSLGFFESTGTTIEEREKASRERGGVPEVKEGVTVVTMGPVVVSISSLFDCLMNSEVAALTRAMKGLASRREQGDIVGEELLKEDSVFSICKSMNLYSMMRGKMKCSS